MAADRIPCLLRRSVLGHPAAVAVWDRSSSINYRNLDAIVSIVEQRLAALGVRGGDRVAILAGNSLAYVASIFALYRLGAVTVPLNQRWPAEMLRDAISLSGSTLLLADQQHSAIDGLIGIESAMIDSTLQELPEKDDRSDCGAQIEIPADRVITIVFTSGSSGAPKGVMLTYGNHYYSALASNENISFGAGDCWLASLPFCHVGGMAVLFRAALSVGTTRLSGDWDAGATSQYIDRGELSHISVVPTMLDSLVRARAGRPFPSSLKAILVGGAQAPSGLLESAVTLLAPIRTSYGMTEAASQICTLHAGYSPDKLRSAGRALACCDVGIVDDNGSKASARATGEIAIRGRSVFAGYLGIDRDRTFDRNGWFLTGDIGELDSEGFLYVHGRKDKMIISGGENIYPEQIERVVAALAEIADCAVIGVDNPTWGKRPVLYYTAAPGSSLSDGELRDQLSQRLPRLFVPDKVFRLDTLPRTAIGKIDRVALRAIYEGQGST
jgi:O-succinylbenzoic acid--CoA ligase